METAAQKALLTMDDHTDDWIDGKGKNIRWHRIFDPEEVKYGKYCCTKGERKFTDLQAQQALEVYNEDLYERLESRSRAIKNWQRLKIVIVILKMSNGRIA